MLLKRFNDKVEIGSAQEFVPIVGHVDNYTLLTKNGFLVQTIYIKGIRKDFIPSNITTARSLIREAVGELNSEKFAAWIHTSRDYIDVSIEKNNQNLFSDLILEKWNELNALNKKFSNCIYISIIYKATNLEISSLSSYLNSFFENIIINVTNGWFVLLVLVILIIDQLEI